MREITPARAIEIIKNLNFRATGETKQANELAIEAVNKVFVPQQVEALQLQDKLKLGDIVFGEGCTIYKCKCGTFVRYMQKHCSECGQLIDWEVEANV